MDKPAVTQRAPYIVKVEAGKTYVWCSCGLSTKQPWCDGSHKGTTFKPISFVAPISGEFHMCGCKESENAPYCFGNCTGNAQTAGDERWRI
jgi:CDGSH-type Zn-finger protein